MLKARAQIVYDGENVIQDLYDRDNYTFKQTVDYIWEMIRDDVDLTTRHTQYMAGPEFLGYLRRAGLVHEDGPHILEVTNPVESIVKLPYFP